MSLISSRCAGVAAAIVATTACTLTACRSYDSLTPGLTGAVVTVVDSGPALAQARSFLIPDTVVDLARTTREISHESDQAITETVRMHLIDLGWHDAATDASPDPDVIVLVGASTRIQTGWYYTDWYSSWGYLPYWGSASASWGWGVPTTAVPYAFPAGTLLLTMLDRRAMNQQTQTITVLWAAALDGVVGTAEGTLERAIVGIDQAFSQSDYLRIQ
ncbi:MAG TPA: DUF4136 domain-containing protein [Gemmatimonadaceae bacterium]|nr:DUF4136 domain-containing protein [Gemmatimonadaceae bacterium]